MEYGENTNVHAMAHHLDQTIEDSDEVMMRRMKNRERQRRYRARKRLETDANSGTSSFYLKPYEGNATNMPMLTSVPQELCYSTNNGTKASAEGQLVLARVELPVVDASGKVATRVRCYRDWKRDARMVQSSTEQEFRFNGHANLAMTSVGGSQIWTLPSTIKDDIPLGNIGHSGVSVSDGGDMHKIEPGRRHWKAEARNRQS